MNVVRSAASGIASRSVARLRRATRRLGRRIRFSTLGDPCCNGMSR